MSAIETRKVPMLRAWRARFTDQSGAELVEAALVMVYLFTLLIGIVWLGRAYNIYATMTRAAREGARYAVAPNCATCATSTCAGNTISVYPTDNQIQSVVNAALSASSLNPSDPVYVSSWSTVACGGQGTQVTVSFSYPVPTMLPSWTLVPALTLSTKVQMQRE